VSLKIVVAEDEAITLKHLTYALGAEGYEVAGVGNGLDALRRIEQGPVDLLIADIKMPGMDGLALLAEVRAKHPGTAVIIVTGFGSVESAVDAMRRGALDYVTKPYNLDELLLKVRRVAEKKRLEHDNEALRAALGLDAGHPFVGRSPAFRKIAETIESIRDSDCTVLLTGESGVGKGLVARLIHRNSPRRDRPFLALNCAVFTEELLASELFGHEKGAFTGAVAAKRGLLEVADTGTLFLDEIAEMPPGLQAKLLKVVEDREFFRVGGTRAIRVDVRFVAATNQNLPTLLASGRFREDLYYRLNVMDIRIPPLRERREDIKPLARHFLAKHARKAHKAIVGFVPAAMQMLLAYGFPGNVRELENIVERAVILEKTERIQPASLPQSIALFQVEALAADRVKTLDELNREYAEKVLEHVEQNRAKAASLLGISRTSLWRILKKEERAAE
jgi:DNA-binding NtrC family response regulator